MSARPVRVLYIVSDLSLGGSEGQLLALSRRLPRDRFEPAFVVIREPSVLAAQAEADGISVHSLGIQSPAQAGPARFVLQVAVGTFRYLRAVRRGRYEIVDAWLYHGYWLAAITHRLLGIPVFVSGRRSLSDFKDGWGWPARRLDALARRRSHAIVANSESVRRDVIRREGADPEAVVVIRNGVDVLAAPKSGERAEARRLLEQGADDFVFGCVSNLKPKKGVDHLLRAFAALPDGRRSRLVLVGDGPLREELAELAAQLGIADRVRFHGIALDVWTLLAGMDVFVHPSETEGLPNAVLEAAAAGLAIVATDAGGTSEVVLDGRTGLLVPIGDVEATAAAMGALRDDADRRATLGSAARSHVQVAFGMERFLAETTALYERLLAVVRT